MCERLRGETRQTCDTCVCPTDCHLSQIDLSYLVITTIVAAAVVAVVVACVHLQAVVEVL